MRRRLLVALVAALGLGPVACGSDDPSRFDAQADEVRSAVAAGDRDAALASLEAVGLEAMQAHAEGELGDEELAELDVLLQHSRALIDEQLPEPTTTTTTTTTAPPPDDDRDDDDRDEGDRGKGNKKDKDDDDD